MNVLKYNRIVEQIILFPAVGALSVIVKDYPHVLSGIVSPIISWTFKGK
jgi:hypothetical protein